MKIGDILDSAFRLYKNNFAKFVHIMAPIYILGFIAGSIYQYALRTPGFYQGETASGAGTGLGIIGIAFSLIFGLITFLLWCVAMAALVHSLTGAYLGEDIRYKDAYSKVRTRFWPLAGIGILSWLMTTIGFVVLFIPGVILSVFLSLVVPVMILEKAGVGGSIARSFGLVSYSFWKTFLVCLVAVVVVGAASVIVYLPRVIWKIISAFSGGSSADPTQTSLMFMILQLALNSFVQVLTSPFWMVAIILLYYDIRVRKEGFDLQVGDSLLHCPSK